jgi:hypothetical protein
MSAESANREGSGESDLSPAESISPVNSKLRIFPLIFPAHARFPRSSRESIGNRRLVGGVDSNSRFRWFWPEIGRFLPVSFLRAGTL